MVTHHVITPSKKLPPPTAGPILERMDIGAIFQKKGQKNVEKDQNI